MPKYTGYRAIQAEGARVGFITCLACGVALLIDPSDKFDVKKLHDEFHRRAVSSGREA